MIPLDPTVKVLCSSFFGQRRPQNARSRQCPPGVEWDCWYWHRSTYGLGCDWFIPAAVYDRLDGYLLGPDPGIYAGCKPDQSMRRYASELNAMEALQRAVVSLLNVSQSDWERLKT